MSQATAEAFNQADAPHVANERPSEAAGSGLAPCRNWSAERVRLSDPARAQLSTAERVVLDAIEVHIADHEEGWPTQKRIAAQTGLSERQVRRCVEVLARRGFLRVRLVLPGGALPSGTRTESVRLVYRRGPLLSASAPRGVVVPFPKAPAERAPAPPPKAEAPPAASPPPAPAAPLPHPDSMSGCNPDSMSAKGFKELKEPNPPLPPAEPAATATAEGPRKCGIGSISEETEPKTEDVMGVLTHWRSTLWPELRGRLDTPSRVAIVLARLVDGFTGEELRWAVDAVTESDWHQAPGQRQRLTVEVLFGKPEMVGELAARGRALQEARERRAKSQERARVEPEDDRAAARPFDVHGDAHIVSEADRRGVVGLRPYHRQPQSSRSHEPRVAALQAVEHHRHRVVAPVEEVREVDDAGGVDLVEEDAVDVDEGRPHGERPIRAPGLRPGP
jgi:hypothetical protein